MLPYDVEDNFSHHKIDPMQSAHINNMRQHYKEVADYICTSVVDSREKSLALTKLEESMFWVNAAIARHLGYHLTSNER